MEQIDACIESLNELKDRLREQNLENTQTNGNECIHCIEKSAEVEKLKLLVKSLSSERKALKRSLDLIKEQRLQDKQTIKLWQERLKLFSAQKSSASTEAPDTHPNETSTERNYDTGDLPTDETRLESSPPRNRAVSSSLTMESIREVAEEAEVLEQPVPPESQSKRARVEVKTEPEDEEGLFVKPMPPQRVTLKSLLERDWHPNDFMINPAQNEGVAHAYHEKVLGKARKHLNCKNCKECGKFEELTGLKLTHASKHRELWSKQDTPPGFWRSGFDTMAESLDRRESKEIIRAEALERLHEAIKGGKYFFKDTELQRQAKEGLIDIE